MLLLPQIKKAKPLHPDTISNMLERTLYSHRVFPLKTELLGFTWHLLHNSHIWIDGRDGLIAGLAMEQLGPALVYLKGPSQTPHDKACTVHYRTVANIPRLRKQEALW